MIITICLLTEKISKFKADNKNINLPSQFCLGRVSNKCDYVDAEEVSLKGNVYYFSVDYDTFSVSVILNIHQCF